MITILLQVIFLKFKPGLLPKVCNAILTTLLALCPGVECQGQGLLTDHCIMQVSISRLQLQGQLQRTAHFFHRPLGQPVRQLEFRANVAAMCTHTQNPITQESLRLCITTQSTSDLTEAIHQQQDPNSAITTYAFGCVKVSTTMTETDDCMRTVHSMGAYQARMRWVWDICFATIA
jgi:hypothetical protein